MGKKFLVFPEGKEKALTLSYDDGINTDIKMLELMERYHIKCTFNLNGGKFGERNSQQVTNRLSKEEAQVAYKHYLCEVATHSYSHSYLTDLSDVAIRDEIVNDRRILEKMFGKNIRGHAYAYGEFNDNVIDILKKEGIVYARTTGSHHSFSLPTDWFRWEATCHHNDPKCQELLKKFLYNRVGENENAWLFYLWGHSYEFQRDDNWHLLETFFEEVSNKSDVWYATNMEVYEYVSAWRELICSADGKSIYNPTTKDVWIKARENIYYISAGGIVEI